MLKTGHILLSIFGSYGGYLPVVMEGHVTILDT